MKLESKFKIEEPTSIYFPPLLEEDENGGVDKLDIVMRNQAYINNKLNEILKLLQKK